MSAAGGGVGGNYGPFSDSRCLGWLNPSTTPVVGGNGRVTTVTNQGTAGGAWGSQIGASVGVAPKWAANALSTGRPGFLFDGTARLGLPIAAQFGGAASAMRITVIAAAYVNPAPSGTATLVIAETAADASFSDPNSGYYSAWTKSGANYNNGFARYDSAGGADNCVQFPAPTPTGTFVMTGRMNPTKQIWRRNGVQVAQNLSPYVGGNANPQDVIVVGGQSPTEDSLGTAFFTGAIGHVLVFNTDLPDSDVSYWESWMMQNSGLA